MSSDEEMEGFEVNADDMRRAMNSDYRRAGGRGRASKEDAMLGVFADRNESDEEDTAATNGGDEELLRSLGYNKSSGKNKSEISFVSKGSFVKKKEAEVKKRETVIVDTYVSTEDESDGEKEVVLDEDGDNSPTLEIKKEYQKPVQNLSGPTFLPSKPTGAATKKPTTSNLNKHEQKDVGNWEKYEKGFGSKMLLKMGWQKGKGLGKQLHGRAVPVEATLRKGKGAVGRYGAESKDVKQADESDEEEESGGGKVHVSQWKKKEKGLEYKTVRTTEELLAMSANNRKKLTKVEQMLGEKRITEVSGEHVSHMSRMKIIDMTGRDTTVHHGYEALSGLVGSSTTTSTSYFQLPELVNNLDMLVNMTESKIIDSEKKIRHFDDQIINLQYESQLTAERMLVEKFQMERIESILQVIQSCELMLESGQSDDLRPIMNQFTQLKSEFPDEFLIFNLSQLAMPLFTPVLKQKLALWRPFEEDEYMDKVPGGPTDPMYCLDLFTQLKSLFANDSPTSVNPFHRLLWDTWMLTFRKHLHEQSIRLCTDRCVDLLDRWATVVPTYMLENLVEKLVLVKLIVEVEAWNPLVDVVPIHRWVHPWLPWLKERMDCELFPMIRNKLGSALSGWHPSDVSAKAILIPWRPPAFSSVSWDTFMIRNIVPKLEMVISDQLIVNPTDQNLEPWHWVMSWLDIIPLTSMVTILDRSFFPKWLLVLHTWLTATSAPNYDEISRWYLGWKGLFCEKLVAHALVKAKLSQGLIMMNRSVSGGPNRDNLMGGFNATQTVLPKVGVEMPTRSGSMSGVQVQSVSMAKITSFKDMIEKKAADHNLLFLPVVNRFSKTGQQVYRFGNLNVYIEKNVIFMLQNGNWMPTSISEIVPKAY